MKRNFVEDNLFKQLQESWIANENSIEEGASEADKQVYFTDDQIVDVKGKGVKLHAAVQGEDGSPAYIDLIIPNDYIRQEGDKKRISSKYVTRAISNFNKGLYATGGIDTSTGYEADDEQRPAHKLRGLQILPKEVNIPRYSITGVEQKDIKDQLVDAGVKINPEGEAKKSIITDSNGKAIIVNVDGNKSYLVGFEMQDQGGDTFRVDGEGDAVVVATMPVPMSKIGSDGIIDANYVSEFVNGWNSGKRYVWDGFKGQIKNVENPKGSQLSVQELSNKLVDLDRFKPEFKQGDVGTQGADPQRHRLQNLATKKLIDDKDIEKAEAKNGKPFTREEFIAFVKDKGLVPPDALTNTEFGKKLLRRWKQNNPRLASYVKSRKKAMSRFQGDKDRFETPTQGRERMQSAADAEEIVFDLDDSILADIPDDAFVVGA
jgi:hypothetical protein